MSFRAASPPPSPDYTLCHSVCQHRHFLSAASFSTLLTHSSCLLFALCENEAQKNLCRVFWDRAGAAGVTFWCFHSVESGLQLQLLLSWMSAYHQNWGVGSSFTSLNKVFWGQMSKDAILLKVLTFSKGKKKKSLPVVSFFQLGFFFFQTTK